MLMRSFIIRFTHSLKLEMPVYAVARGRCPGIYDTWAECQAEVTGFSGSIYKKFNTRKEAEDFIKTKIGGVLPPSSSKTSAHKPKTQLNKFINPISKSDHEEKLSTKRTFPEAFKIKEKGVKKPKLTKTYGEHEFLEDEDGFVHVYTDGSCFDNGKKAAAAGYGVYFGENHKLNTGAPVSGRATNNCGEIQAATLSIKLAKQVGISKLVIHTDSQFLINAICLWIKSWKRKDWKLADGKPVKNKTDFMELDDVIMKSNITIRWNYVKAHQGTLGNERADQLAKEGAEIYRIVKTSRE